MNEFPVLLSILLSTKSVFAKLDTALSIYIISCFFLCVPISQFVSSVWSIALTHLKWFAYWSTTRWEHKIRHIDVIHIACKPISEWVNCSCYSFVICSYYYFISNSLVCVSTSVKTTTLTFSSLLSEDDKAACTVWVAILHHHSC